MAEVFHHYVGRDGKRPKPKELTAKQKEQRDARADLVRAQTRERVAKAALAEMEARKRTGELVERADVQWQAKDILTRLRQGLLAVPMIIMRRLPPGVGRDDRHKVRMIVDEEVRRALNELVGFDTRVVDEDSRKVNDDE
jgi:phage terminase Nu1 subunit (DNA packaging protein)